jgi:hypothetical protein
MQRAAPGYSFLWCSCAVSYLASAWTGVRLGLLGVAAFYGLIYVCVCLRCPGYCVSCLVLLLALVFAVSAGLLWAGGSQRWGDLGAQ